VGSLSAIFAVNVRFLFELIYPAQALLEPRRTPAPDVPVMAELEPMPELQISNTIDRRSVRGSGGI
jgi:hypothetical protein